MRRRYTKSIRRCTISWQANKVRKKPLRVILNGLGKDAAQIISRINGFTYVETEYDPYKNEVKEVFRKSYSEGLRAKVLKAERKAPPLLSRDLDVLVPAV